MKKRLLTLMLVAFVLCTMAINSFALMNSYGQPLILDYANWSKCYGEYNWRNDSNYQRELFYYGECPYCGNDVTYINVDIPYSLVQSLPDDPNENIYGDRWATIVVGSYYDFNRFGFKPSNYLVYTLSDWCDVAASGQTLKGRVFLNYADDSSFYKPYVHYKMDLASTNGMVEGGWYVGIFTASDSNIGSTMFNYAANWRSAYESNGLNDLYESRQRDFLLRNFTSSEFNELSRQYIYDEGYSEGLRIGSDGTYEEAYQDGFTAGTLHGQDMTDWTFSELLTGVFGGFNSFFNPFLSLGVGDITISTILGLCGVVFISMFVIKIVRGA